MPKISRQDASKKTAIRGYEGAHDELEGYTVVFETYSEDQDLAHYLKGLPDDRCQCPHWGYVLKGRLSYRFADHEETIEAGEAYYIPPGHTPIIYAGAEVVEFSPTDELRKTLEVVNRNAERESEAA
jgi:hypothetical protein